MLLLSTEQLLLSVKYSGSVCHAHRALSLGTQAFPVYAARYLHTQGQNISVWVTSAKNVEAWALTSHDGRLGLVQVVKVSRERAFSFNQ